MISFEGTDKYKLLDASLLRDGQTIHVLPDPLLSYTLPTGVYVFGFSLWPAIAVGVLLSLWGARRARRRRVSRFAADAQVPIATEGPAVLTDSDRYIQAQIAGQLQAEERITHQAYGTTGTVTGGGVAAFRSAATQKGVLAALTGERLFLIETRVGAFKPPLENRGVEVIPRARIRGVERADEQELRLTLDDGATRTIIVQPGTKHFSNQAAFVRDLPRVLAASAAAAPSPWRKAGSIENDSRCDCAA